MTIPLFKIAVASALIIIFNWAGPIPSGGTAMNLALHKPYTTSPLPSYPLSAPPTDRSSLTDGKYTAGHYWTQKTTVGWHPVKSVEILIDLEKILTIGSISFSTARGIHAGVYYPVHVYVFVGPDKDRLRYVGDIVDSPENRQGDYKKKRFVLSNIAVKGRYVLLEISAPKSHSVFCDEVEVHEGLYDDGQSGGLTIHAARRLTEQSRWLGLEKELHDRVSAGNTLLRWDPAKTDISLENDILRIRGELLRERYPSRSLLIEPKSPWAPLSPASPPNDVHAAQPLSFVLAQESSDHASIVITNMTASSRAIHPFMVKSAENAPEVSLFETLYVKSAEREYVADALVPVKRAVMLRPGESKMLFLHAKGKEAGNWKGSLLLTDGDISFSHSIPVEIAVLSVAYPRKQTLNAVNWGYLDSTIITSSRQSAVNDLYDHHTDTLVVPRRYLKGANQVESPDFRSLKDYLSAYRGADKIMLGVGFGVDAIAKRTGKYPFMTSQWKNNFVASYNAIALIAADAGFMQDQIYYFPYDEMSGVQVDDFLGFAKWAKKELPGMQLYATLSVKESLRALPYLDIAQIHNNDELLRHVHADKTEIWIYDCSGPAKSLSPYSYYRLMAWKAYLRGYTGIGFWAYADAGDSGTAWNDFDGTRPDYAVIYEGEGNSIISSRRWEAWRMGIEDYELLTMYAKKHGEKASHAFAREVLDHPEDTTRADAIRRKILYELSGIVSNRGDL